MGSSRYANSKESLLNYSITCVLTILSISSIIFIKVKHLGKTKNELVKLYLKPTKIRSSNIESRYSEHSNLVNGANNTETSNYLKGIKPKFFDTNGANENVEKEASNDEVQLHVKSHNGCTIKRNTTEISLEQKTYTN